MALLCKVLTRPQRIIFNEVKEFVLSHMKHSTNSKLANNLTMPNNFPAREEKFIADLSAALHLDVSWDEYDDEDQNLVVFRLPGGAGNGKSMVNDGASGNKEGKKPEDINNEEDDGQWEDVTSSESSDDPEALSAIERVLKKYESAKTVEDEEGDFDTRYEHARQERMDEWKSDYYRVSLQEAC